MALVAIARTGFPSNWKQKNRLLASVKRLGILAGPIDGLHGEQH
jgi:hypothetical protein